MTISGRMVQRPWRAENMERPSSAFGRHQAPFLHLYHAARRNVFVFVCVYVLFFVSLSLVLTLSLIP